MGSVGSPNPLPPYDKYSDCSRATCNIYCPQWCYFFPPPPLPDDDSGTKFSPLILAIIGVLAGTLLLLTYFTILSKYCRARRGHDRGHDQEDHPIAELEGIRRSRTNFEQSSNGLEEALVRSIAVFRYTKEDRLIEGTECAVCLGEFREGEGLRLLPNCTHAFHLPCIDTWLKSHSNCPLCRSDVLSGQSLPPPPSRTQSSSVLHVSSLEIEPQNDLTLVVDDPDTNTSHASERYQLGRSVSLGAFSSRGQLLVADILRISEEDEDEEMESIPWRERIGSSQRMWEENGAEEGGNGAFLRGGDELKRSISTGSLNWDLSCFVVMTKGNKFLLPVFGSWNSGGKGKGNQ
ncbi:hypothetical protein NMG60_11023235 [Bertholletia excelsa]